MITNDIYDNKNLNKITNTIDLKQNMKLTPTIKGLNVSDHIGEEERLRTIQEKHSLTEAFCIEDLTDLRPLLENVLKTDHEGNIVRYLLNNLKRNDPYYTNETGELMEDP